MKKLVEFNGFWFGENTPNEVKNIIVSNYNGRKNRLRFWFGNENGESWGEENDICGYIGMSSGSKKIPLLISRINSFGGGALMDECVVKIVDIKTNCVLYQHENFKQSIYSVITPSDMPEYAANVLQDGSIYARCKKITSAKRLSDFMNGKRHNK